MLKEEKENKANVIRISNLSYCYGNATDEKKVLDGVNLSIAPAEVFGLLGPSGAGKTTLIKLITGQLKVKDGQIRLMGKDSNELAGQDFCRVGIMMEQLGVYERLSCYDNLKLFAMLGGVKNSSVSERVKAALRKVCLEESAGTLAMNLSKGMRSRLLLARAILNSPEVLFLDEPTSGLDPKTAKEIHNFILEEKEKGTVIFLTTHNMAEAEALCDNVALLNDGKIVEYGEPREMCLRYNHQKKIVIHLTDGACVELQHSALAGEAIAGYLGEGKVATIHSGEPNLETVFMELTGRRFE